MQAFNLIPKKHEKNSVLDKGRASGAMISSPAPTSTKVMGPGVEKEEGDEYEKMLIAITGKSRMERSTKDKAVKFPQKVSSLVATSLNLGPPDAIS